MPSTKPSAKTTDTPTGPAIIDKMAAEPSLDRFFLQIPNFTPDELREFVRIARAERALWETKK